MVGVVLVPHCPSGELSWWGVVLVGNCPGMELSWWGVVMVGNCPDGELSWWGVVLEGSHLGGSCPGVRYPVGSCPRTINVQ